MHPIEEAFGKGCSLYADVLKCPNDATAAQLRKAYYRAALEYHPDKNPGGHSQFQAVSMAYQILKDKESRECYDETGEIPDARDDDEEDFGSSTNPWKDYFDRIFGKVTASDIDAFAAKYKCSDEERRDVLREFVKQKGNLVKMLDFVMLSTEKDAIRWVEDYLKPAIESKEVSQDLETPMTKSLEKVQKKLEKENQKEKEMEEDASATESEDELPPEIRIPKAQKKTPVKAKPTKTKRAKKKDDMSDLIAQIQNKRRGGASVLNGLAARYGGSMDDPDPMNDAEFAKTRDRLDKKRKSR